MKNRFPFLVILILGIGAFLGIQILQLEPKKIIKSDDPREERAILILVQLNEVLMVDGYFLMEIFNWRLPFLKKVPPLNSEFIPERCQEKKYPLVRLT